MLIIGITGGIGSGKTTVARIIEEKGYKVIYSDNKAKELMASNPEVRQKLIDAFGEESYNGNNVNPGFISSKVFADNDKEFIALAKLNSIVHPYVIDDMIEQVEQYEKDGEQIVFVESALIYEAELEDGFDFIIDVYSPLNVTIERIKSRNNLSAEQITRRMEAQLPIEEKKNLADFVIDNSGSLNELKNTTDFVLNIVTLMGT